MDRKTVIAWIVLILIFLLLPYYYKLITPQKAAPEKPQDTTAQVIPETTQIVQAEEPAPVSYPDTTRKPDTTAAVITEFPRDDEPRVITVETPLYHLEFSTRGGVLTSAILKQYRGHNGGKVELIRPNSPDNLDLALFRKGNPLDLKQARFVPNRDRIIISGSDGDSLILQAEGADSRVRKVFHFWGDRYTIGMTVQARNIPDLDPGYGLVWGSGLKITETDTAQDVYYSSAYASMGGILEQFEGKEPTKSMEGTTEWVAQRRKYFEVAIVPNSGPGAGAIFAVDVNAIREKHRIKNISMSLRMPGTLTQEEGRFTIYLGPMDEKLLSQAHPQLEATMSWGWKVIEPLSKLVVWMLKALHTFISNYGLVVVAFSIVIKIVLWPLTHKSTKSMARMAALQPKMKELQEKYKGNPDKINKAVMQLYKDEKVNPFSGCWPMLLQMPLLFALFGVFRSTIEFRGAPFVWWITDLSMPDFVYSLPFSIPFYGAHVAILPLIMGVTQLFSMKLTITDPKQKFNVYFMPLFMTLFFNTLPSGLTLYYTLFNVWTYLQQMWMKKRGEAATAEAGGN